MGKVSVNCPQCGHAMNVDEDLGAVSLACPACGTPIPVQAAAGPAEPRAKLQVKQDGIISGSYKRCPMCDTTADADAVICVHCGYDWRSGRRPDMPTPAPASSQRLVIVIAAAVAAGVLAGAVAIKIGRRPAPAPTPPAVAQVPQPAPGPPPPPAPAPAQTGGVPAAAEPPAEPEGPSPEELAHTEALYRLELHQELDRRLPMCEKDTEVALRMDNGLVCRGTFVGVKHGVAVIMQDGNSQEIPLQELDRTSRLRIDKDYRDRLVDFRVRRRMQKLESP